MTALASVTDNSAHLISPTSEPIGTAQPKIKPSKQLNYYYRHKLDRLAFQRDYYSKHKLTILNNKKNHYYSNKVKRTQKNISLLRIIHRNYYCVAKRYVCHSTDRRLFDGAFQHSHGRPNERRNRSRYALPSPTLWFHIIPDIQFTIDRDPYIFITKRKINNKQVMTSRQLSLQTAHFLGLHAGDSFYWRELNPYIGKVETHCLCFDGSGLDISHPNDLPKLVECRIETNAKGMGMLILFAEKHSVNHYLQVFRGNRLFLTSETENAYRDYVKHF